MTELIRKLKNCRITEITPIHKITFWITVIGLLIAATILILKKLWIV